MNIKMPKNMNKIKSATALSLVVFLTACGGGGGGDDSSQVVVGNGNAPVTAPPSTSGGRTITGLASKSPIAGADVSLYEIDNFGNPLSTAVATGQTDDNGEFSLSVTAEGDLLLKTSGGVFIDESDQEPDLALKRRITLGTGEGFMSLIAEGSSTAAITPFTDILVRRAQNEAAERGGFSTSFDIIKSLIDDELGFDVLTTIPANPISPAAGSTASQMQYALFLGAFANALNNISQKLGEANPTYDIIQAVAEDLSDGELDGQYFGDPVMVYDNDNETSTPLPGGVDFSQELARFRNNNFAEFSTTTLPEPTGASLSNEPPTANAGDDQTAMNGDTVTLSGVQSSDPEGLPLSFNWQQESESPTVTLTGANTATPSFVVDTGVFAGGVHSFLLTVTDSVGYTSTDRVSVTIGSTLSTSIFVIADSGQFIDDGNPIDGGAKFDFDQNGTGEFFGDQGAVPFDWSETGEGSVLIDFSGMGGLIEDEYTDFGNDFGDDFGFDFGGLIGRSLGGETSGIEIEVREVTNTFEFTLMGGEGLGLGARVMVTVSGVIERFDVIEDVQLADEPFTETENLAIYDATVHTPFTSPVTARVLPTAAQTGTPSLYDDELYDDQLSFDPDGSGFALYKNQSFTWTIETDGHLKVIFSDGEIAEYFRYGTVDDGDVIGVLYTNVHGDVVSDGFLSVTQESVELNTANVAGIYTVEQNFDLDDGTIVDQSRTLRLYPNGTAQFERVAIDPATGDRFPVFLPFGICWEAVENGITITTGFDSFGINTNASDCSVPLSEFSPFNRTVLSVLQIEGSTYRSHAQLESSVCLDEVETSNCEDTNVNDIFLVISEKVTLTATPVYAIEDTAVAGDLSNSIDIDVLQNDVAGDSAIDLTSVVIETQPQFGTVSVNSTTGLVTYTPGAEFDGDDAFFYRVSDANGLQSSFAPVIISFDPVADAGSDITTARSGDLVMLDGTGSAAPGGLNYTWNQLSGPGVALSDPHSPTPTFEALAFPVSGSTFEFELEVEDENGNFDYDYVDVVVPPSIPMTFFASEDLTVPIQFSIDVDTEGSIFTLNANGTGIVNDRSGSFTLDWTESAGSLVLDFSGNPGGGLVFGSFTTFEDVDGLTGDEEVMVTEIDVSAQVFFDMDTDGKDIADVINNVKEERFDVTNSMALPDQFLTEDSPVAIYDPADQVPYADLGGATLSLPTDVSVAVPTVRDAPVAQTDELSFAANGTGTSRFKGETFVWSIGVDGHLEVEFSGGDIANYFNVEARDSGDYVSVLYQYNSGDVRGFADLSFEKNVVSPFTAGNIAGVYSTIGEFELDDGTYVPQMSNYIVNADGTGIFEGENLDPVTGESIGWFSSSFGICAVVDMGGDMTWYRTRNLDARYMGSRQPSASHCSTLTMADVAFMRTHTLFEEQLGGDIAVLVANGENDCGIPVTPAMGCDENTINITGYFPTIFNYTSYDGQAPITVPDADSMPNGGTQSFDVLSNDIMGDTTIDPGSVEIVVQPVDGMATVNLLTGEITVTVDTAESVVTVYYRVSDMSGNVSTISPLDITVVPM